MEDRSAELMSLLAQARETRAYAFELTATADRLEAQAQALLAAAEVEDQAPEPVGEVTDPPACKHVPVTAKSMSGEEVYCRSCGLPKEEW